MNVENYTANVYCGVAGWSYPDWEGIVYPKPKPKSFDPLVFLSGFIDVIEINSTYYHPGSKKNALAWARRLSGASGFRFTVKLWQRFSHQREPFGVEEIEQARVVPDVLAEAGLLGAVLVQFPWSFRNNQDNRRWLIKVADAFKDFPLTAEVRHASWDRPEVYNLLEDRSVSYVNIDQPVIGDSLKPSSIVTAEPGYVRLHGRNYQDWFRKEAGRDDRYNFLYSEDELKPWAERILKMTEKGREVFVVFNNHYKGQALVNALQMKSLLGLPVGFPGGLLDFYPALSFMSA